MWVVRGVEEMHPVHLYNFKWTRSGKNVLEFLDGFEGCVLQSDGYSGNLPTQIVIFMQDDILQMQ